MTLKYHIGYKANEKAKVHEGENNGVKLRNLFEKLNDITHIVDPNSEAGETSGKKGGVESDEAAKSSFYEVDSDDEVDEHITMEKQKVSLNKDRHLPVQNINHSAFSYLEIEKKMHVIEQSHLPSLAPEAGAEPNILAQWTLLYRSYNMRWLVFYCPWDYALMSNEKGLPKKAKTPQKKKKQVGSASSSGNKDREEAETRSSLLVRGQWVRAQVEAIEFLTIENQLEKTIKAIRSDRGGEYISQEFKDYLKANGIVQQLTPPYTPQRNRVSERRNRTLLDMVRSMMNLTALPLSFWDYALESAIRILNMVPTKKVDKTPYKLWYEKVLNLSYLKVWGCEALVKRDTPDKLEQRSYLHRIPKGNDGGDHGPNPFILLEAIASNDLWIWHAFFGVFGMNNDVNVLRQSPIFNDLKSGRASDVPFVANDVPYKRGYYLTDRIYPPWFVLIKSIKNPGTNDHKRILYKIRHEAARKNVERAFGILKKKWKIIKYPARWLTQSRLSDIMYTCLILHNMIIHDKGKAICLDYFSEEQHRADDPVRTHAESMQFTQDIIDRTAHLSLKADLVEHIWNNAT
ncbi:ALP1-like protein [Tanacetum coccineum]